MDEKLQAKLAKAFRMAIGAIDLLAPEVEAAVAGVVILGMFDNEELSLIDSMARQYGKDGDDNGEAV